MAETATDALFFPGVTKNMTPRHKQQLQKPRSCLCNPKDTHMEEN